nr:CHAT domain-containing protein [Streptomyces sp. NBC_00995]
MEQQDLDLNLDLDLEIPFDGYDEFGTLPRSTPLVVQDRTIHLSFDQIADGFLVQAYSDTGVLPYDGNAPYKGRLRLKPEEISLALSDIQEAWLKATVQYKFEGHYPFDGFPAQSLGAGNAGVLLQDACETLARAGQVLYRLIFTSGDDGLKRLEKALSKALRSGPQVITVTSEDLFVPWGLLYLHPDSTQRLNAGDAATWDGFLGYTHLVEHNLGLVEGYDPFIDHGEVRPNAGLYLDTRLERPGSHECPLTPVRNVFDTHATAREQTTKADTARHLTAPDCPDHILFFGAHASGIRVDHRGPKPASLTLSDNKPISAGDIRDWALDRDQRLPDPLCFMMTCEGGRAGQFLHEGLARPLFALGIGCLIGPQIEIPKIVASALASRFFEEFFKGERAACILRNLTRDFISQHATPLALAFTLIRGIDNCLVHHPLAEIQ